MNSGRGRRIARTVLLCGLLFSLPACYYVQAARGQFDVMRRREPIAELINADETPIEFSTRLRVIVAARQFSIDELGLPDNGSYRSFADLERDYALWNVIAAPEFSLQPRQWCYPIVGCVSYRGYFKEATARRLAAKLEEDGYDVLVGGVAAYSTLGRFDDPILNTMMHWEDVDLVAVMFHELAHQLIYIKDDSAFNESFATAVEEFGIERWLQSRGQAAEIVDYHERRALQRQLMGLIEQARDDLETIYASADEPQVVRKAKQERLSQLTEAALQVYADGSRTAPDWWRDDLNNARLASMTLYQGLLPAFRTLLAQCDGELQCFYAEAQAIAELDEDQRDARLAGH